MPRLAFSTNAFKKQTLTEAVDAIAAVGYQAVEIMADVPHAYPARFTAADRQRLKSQLTGLRIPVSNVNAFTHFADGDTYHPTWIEDDESLRRRRIDHTIRSIELANDLGAATVSLQPGGPLIGTSITPRRAAERFARGLEAVLPTARRLGVALCIEPEPGLFIQDSSEYRAFKRDWFANESQIRMNCDVGHLFCVGDDPAGVIRAMPFEIAHVHLEDIGENRVHQHLTPGTGVIDFGAIFDALADVHYSGWVTVELYPYEATAAEVAGRAFGHLTRPLEAQS